MPTGCRCRDGIGDIKAPRTREKNGSLPGRRVQAKARLLPGELDVGGTKMGTLGERCCRFARALQLKGGQGHLFLTAFCQGYPPVILYANDGMGRLIPLKKSCLAGKIGLLCLMIIQMITGQMGKDGHLPVDAGCASLLQGMGGDLHNHHTTLGCGQALQSSLQGNGIWRRQRIRQVDAWPTDAGSAYDAHFSAIAFLLLQDGFEHGGGAGFAVGTGDGHHGHVAAGMTIKGAGEQGEGDTWLRVNQLADLFGQLQRAIMQNGQRTGCQSLFDKVGPRGGAARKCGKKITGLHLARVGAQAIDDALCSMPGDSRTGSGQGVTRVGKSHRPLFCNKSLPKQGAAGVRRASTGGSRPLFQEKMGLSLCCLFDTHDPTMAFDTWYD